MFSAGPPRKHGYHSASSVSIRAVTDGRGDVRMIVRAGQIEAWRRRGCGLSISPPVAPPRQVQAQRPAAVARGTCRWGTGAARPPSPRLRVTGAGADDPDNGSLARHDPALLLGSALERVRMSTCCLHSLGINFGLIQKYLKYWSRGRELNPRPTDYESRYGANSAGSRQPNRADWRGFRVTVRPGGTR